MYSLLQWTETCEGIHYPRGGFHKVPASLVSIAENQPTPAKFHYGAPVRQVTYDASGRTTGIELENGERKEADVVVVNADLAWAYNNLFKKDGGGDASGQAEAGEGLLDPRKAQKLLEKPHSSVASLMIKGIILIPGVLQSRSTGRWTRKSPS